MSFDTVIELKEVWKKYSVRHVLHRSIREDIINNLVGKKTDQNQADHALREGEFWALKDINILLRKGECVGIYGPNGSGKTTIVKLMASVTYPTKGKVTVQGRVAPLISVSAGFHPDLTGRENIYMNGTIIGMGIREIKEKIEAIIEFSGIQKRFIDMPVKKYSSGMNARLGFSIAVHSDAEILLLDEILAVGDESFKDKCLNRLNEIRTEKTIVLVTHNRRQMEEIVDRTILIKEGSIVQETKRQIL